jgi:hypothetical protein
MRRCFQRGGRPVHAFSGPRSRGGDFCSRSLPHEQRLGAAATSVPRMGPAPACPNPPPFRRRRHPVGAPLVVANSYQTPLRSAGRAWGLRPHARTPHPFVAGGIQPRAPLAVVAGRWWRPRAQAPFAARWLHVDHADVQATADGEPIRSPASVGRRTRATPATCRSGIGAHGGVGTHGGIGARGGVGARSAAAEAETTSSQPVAGSDASVACRMNHV